MNTITRHRAADAPSPSGPSRTRSSSPSTSSSHLISGPVISTSTPVRPPLSRMSRMRSQSPHNLKTATNTPTKYLYASVFLALSLVSFVVQTELSSIIQHDLGWNKAYCMMYFTHGSWVILWPIQLAILRLRNRHVPWATLWRRHVQLLHTTAAMVQTRQLSERRAWAMTTRASVSAGSPAIYIVRTIASIAVALTVAGLSWYVAVNMTTPSDVTAIFNCSAFFAYAFSVPILRERLRLDKVVAVLIAIVGVMVVAYGDVDSDDGDASDVSRAATSGQRFLGNVIIGIGSIMYGMYEVLYKRYACPPDGVSPHRGMLFAIAVASAIGTFTLLVLWIPLPLLHMTGIEPFRLPTGYTACLVLAAIGANATFSGSFFVLISLTSPVLSSVAALLTIFLVAIADWFLKHKALSGAAILGGLLIVGAFVMLSWTSYKELAEHDGTQPVDSTDSDSNDDNHNSSDVESDVESESSVDIKGHAMRL